MKYGIEQDGEYWCVIDALGHTIYWSECRFSQAQALAVAQELSKDDSRDWEAILLAIGEEAFNAKSEVAESANGLAQVVEDERN